MATRVESVLICDWCQRDDHLVTYAVSGDDGTRGKLTFCPEHHRTHMQPLLDHGTVSDTKVRRFKKVSVEEVLAAKEAEKHEKNPPAD